MKNRIYLNFLGLLLLSALLLTGSVSFVVSKVVKDQEKAAVRDRAVLAADLLNYGVSHDRLFTDYTNYSADAARITIIAPDGTVLLDNKAVAASMGDHSDREEFIKAIQTGNSEIMRYSSTLRVDTYYYAILLDDGNVLRVSKDMGKITAVFGNILSVIILITVIIMLLATVVARRLTQNILSPLNWIDFSGENIVVYDELIPYMKKINQQKREINWQLTALENRADTIEDITRYMREGLILLDNKGIVLTANKSISELFGDAYGKNILTMCREVEFQQGVKKCLSGEDAEILFEHGDKIYNVYFNPAHSGTGGAVILFFDITARHESERQRREFSANVSHELKTPLTSISAYAELIENGMAKAEDIQGFASKILVQARRLISIINDIIQLSEFDEDKIGAEYQEFDLHELVRYVMEVLREKAEAKNISVSVTDGHFRINANQQMIDELIYNLLDNAIKYSREDDTVTVKLSEAEEFYKIEVTDIGIGIPREHHGRVFERFYRVDKSRGTKTGGTGLGLSIVKHITEHHGGRVELKSAIEEGTTITCWIMRGI